VEKTTVHDEMRALLGDNLFDLPYRMWLPRRRALQPIFTKKSVAAFGAHVVEAAESTSRRWLGAKQIDLDAECRLLTLRALGRSVLGLDLDDHADSLGEPLRVALKYIADRGLRPVRAPRWLPTPARRRARAAAATLHDVAAEVLRGCRADPLRDAPLVHALMAVRDADTGLPLSDAAICNELVAFMAAGHDTTATLLTYALWALGTHPEMQARVAAEVVAVGDRDLTPRDVSNLRYTVQVLQESLRLCPPAAALPRTALRDIEVDGYRVDAGTVVIFGIYAVHRDPALWENPLVFDPDRFNANNIKAHSRWQFVPFGAGPRSCIGDHFAMLEAALAVATIIRRVQLHCLPDCFRLSVPFTTVAAGPVSAHIRARPIRN
jgi:cytochrome P450